jgi:hypothetical protein
VLLAVDERFTQKYSDLRAGLLDWAAQYLDLDLPVTVVSYAAATRGSLIARGRELRGRRR